MVKNCTVAICIILLLLFITLSFGQITVKIAASELIYDSFSAWTAKIPFNEIINYNGSYANRGTVELVLLCQALQRGGLDFNIEVVKCPNYSRALMLAQSGQVTLPAETIWEQDLDLEALYKTDPIIRNGEFEKGIYTSPENHKMLAVTSFDEFGQYSAVMIKSWAVDWNTLRSMDLKRLDEVAKKDLLFKMVNFGRVDFTLLEFSSEPDLSTEIEGIKLVPVPNLKIGLKGERCWAVAKIAPDAEKVFAALQKGIIALRDKGIISRAYHECGFFNAAVENWKKYVD